MRKISKQFKRLAILALGLSIALAGVLGIVHFNNSSGDVGQEYAYANLTNGRIPGNLSISGTTLSWQFWWSERTFDDAGSAPPRWHNLPGTSTLNIRGQLTAGTSFNNHWGQGFERWYNTQILRNGVVVHTLNWTNSNSTPPARTVNLNNISALSTVGTHSITVRTSIREYWGNEDSGRASLRRVNTYTSAAINRTVTGTLGVPGNVRMEGNTLRWNAVGNANGYRVYRGGVHISTPGNVTSLDLYAHMASNPTNIPVGALHNFTVRATSTASYWNNSGISAGVNWGRLATPTPSLSGTSLLWNSVTGATQYLIRLGDSVIHTIDAVAVRDSGVSSYNLMHIGNALLPLGYHNNINIVAISSASYWYTSVASEYISWTRFAGLCVATDVAINGSILNWGIGEYTLEFIDYFHIMLGDMVIASVGRDTRAFDLASMPEGRNAGRDFGVAGSLGVMQAGMHDISIISASNLPEWDDTEASKVVNFYRAARVDSISISGNPNLIVSWPRPDGVNGMPSSELVASVVGLYGSDKSILWHSSNPDIVSVDAGSGFIRASWPSGLTMWELAVRNHNTFTVITARSVLDNSVIAQMQVLVVFETPPVPIVVGVSVSGGLRELEIAACGTKLSNAFGGGSLVGATQFVASAYGYNLAGADNHFTWASSNESVATIDAEGRLTVRGAGITRITATSAIGNVPYSFDVVVIRGAVATVVSIFCDRDNSVERRLSVVAGEYYGFVDLRAVIEGHNLTSQLVTWTSSCGATLGNPSEFLSFSLVASESGEPMLRVTGLAQAGPLLITATPVHSTGAVGTFRIFVDALVNAEVTNVSIATPATNALVIPLNRPLLATDLPIVQLTASLTGVGGAAGTNVVWTSSCGARAGLGLENIQGQFVAFVLSLSNPNIVTVVALDRGQAWFAEQVTITATSVVTPSVYASREFTVEQAAVKGISTTTAIGGQTHGFMMIPYGYTDVNARGTLDLRAVVSVSHASVSHEVIWFACTPNVVIFDNKHQIAQGGTHSGAFISAVTLRPLAAGVITIWAEGALCGTPSNKFTLEIIDECRTSVRIIGPVAGVFEYQMNIRLPRPDAIELPIVQLGASVGGSFARASALVWTSSCGGEVVEFLGAKAGNIVMLRAVGAGIATITATHPTDHFVGTFTVVVDQASLNSIEILGDSVVQNEIAMLIPLVYENGIYTLSSITNRQSLELSLNVITHGEVSTDFVWTSSDPSVIRINGTGNGDSEYENGDNGFSKITDRNGNVAVLPYGVGTATIRAVSTIDSNFYTEFTIFVTRGTASCSIQDGILDLPTIEEGYVRIILVCEHYFGQARMSHTDMSLEYAQNFELPTLEINITGAIFFGWSLSRGGAILETLPIYLLDIEYGLDTLLIFAVWYIPYVPTDNNGSNLARNIIIGTLSVAGVGAAGTAGYIAQSKIRARRKENIDEWGMD